ncbi:TetR/AcrR family transcriptional regulator [Actinomadura barringtoniae]|uniref:TetR/AcrR family transcriptional regulator n=1 Tax=Actinomadura barringtoniae TaxID=1427535 RepID=A0A939T9K7_9ACTN|nr:TetR/AcrR family transcriptional regulator [Actinomadura barringtoniae]MBO2454374.1 TetR/AcrR family transcriptional regulator [Actinomadura barringtoniae]
MAEIAASNSKRRYQGMDGHEREANRRERLLQTGLDLFGTVGYHDTTVVDICRQAGVARRFFYESFADREALLLAVYDVQIQRLQGAVLNAVAAAGPRIEDMVEASIDAYVHQVLADERAGRLIFVEIFRGGPTAEARRHEVRHQFYELIITLLTESLSTPRSTRIEMGVTILVGGVADLAGEWLLGHSGGTIDDICRTSTDMFNTIYHQFLQELAAD